MNKDTVIYIHCPELIECPLHFNESQLIDGLLKEISDIIKYSMVITENRSLSYLGRRIDLDYKVEHDQKNLKTLLKYSYIFREKTLTSVADLTKLLNEIKEEKAFINEYTRLIKGIVSDIGDKTSKCSKSPQVIVKYADLKKHYNK